MCIRDRLIVDVEASSEQGDDPAAPRVHRQSFNHRHHKGQPMSKAGNRLLRTTLVRAADHARRADPQLAQIYYTQMVERGAEHLKACCVVAAHLAERLHAVLVRGMPYVVCDTDGSPVDPATAKRIIFERWTVPLEVRARRRSRKPAAGQRGTPTPGSKSGKAPHQDHPGHERSDARGADDRGDLPRRASSAAIPDPIKATPEAAAREHPPQPRRRGAISRPGTALPAVSPCPGPAGTRGTRAGAAGPAGTRSALDAWGAGPYQRPAADPLDKPAPIGNQTYDIPCTMIGSGCCTGPISSVEQKGGDHHTATRPCPGGCGTVGRRVQLLVWQVGPLGRRKGQAVIDTAASSRRWRPGTPRRLAGRTAGPVRCSGSRSEIVLGGGQPVQRSGSGAPAAGRPGAAAGGAADPDGR